MKCKIIDCTNESRKLGWCNMHYTRFKRNGDPLKLKRLTTCTYEGCFEPHHSKGLCQNHYRLNKRNGKPEKKIYPKICMIEGCDKSVKSNGLCSSHERSEWRKLHPELVKLHNDQNKERKRQLKKEAVDYKGGKCSVCGYSKYQGALEFHHINPSEKEDTIANLINELQTLEQMKNELNKCILVCSNCHKEIHGDIIEAGSQ